MDRPSRIAGITQAIVSWAVAFAISGTPGRAAAPVAEPVFGFAIAQQPATGLARRLTVVVQVNDVASIPQSSGVYAFDPTRATVTLRRTDIPAHAVVLRVARRENRARVSFGAVAVVAGATYRVDVKLRPGSIRLGARTIAVPAFAPVAIIGVPGTPGGTKDTEVARVSAAFASVPPLPNIAGTAVRATVLRNIITTCQSAKGTGIAGQSPGDTVIYAGVVRGTASDAENNLDAAYPPFNALTTPVYLSTAPLVVTMFGTCDAEVHAFTSADEVLHALRPTAPDSSPSPSTSPSPA